MYLVFPMFTAKPISLQAFNNTSVFFNLYGEYFKKEALAEVVDFKIGGRIINKVRFVDDMAIIAKTQEELQDMVNRLVDTGRGKSSGLLEEDRWPFILVDRLFLVSPT